MGYRIVSVLVIVALFGSCKNNVAPDTSSDKTAIAAMLDSFNRAAANAEYDRYFNFYTDDAVIKPAHLPGLMNYYQHK